MKYLKQFSRFFVAAVFLFSGFVKIVDPIGTSVKLEKYFHVFANHVLKLNGIEGEQVSAYLRGEVPLGFLSELSIGIFDFFATITLPFAVFVIALEMILGFALLIGYRMKNVAWVLLGMIVFFTILTFYTAQTGDPSDCGCFGDFIKLEPIQSFYKDLVLLVFVIVIFVQRNRFETVFSPKVGHVVMGWLTFITFFFAIWTVRNIPLIDFRPYAIGNNLEEQTSGTPDQYWYKFDKEGEAVIAKDGANIPAEYWKPPYTFVESYVGVKGVEPPIVDFNLENEYGDDLKTESYEGKSMYIVTRTTKPLSEELILQLSNLETAAMFAGVKVYLLSSISQADYEALLKGKLNAVKTTLDTDISKAVIRSDVGVLTLENGTVQGKWGFRGLPSNEELLSTFSK